jgi:AcrR family transcriptional regulator
MNLQTSTARRGYRMTARAESAAATGERILDAAVSAFWEQPADDIPLEEVARRADVSVQTVIRRFGGKDGLFRAAVERESARVENQRDEAPVGDTEGAVRILIEHYETTGDRVLKLLTEEDRVPRLREVTDSGRQLHRDWCERVFAPALVCVTGADRRRRLAQLVAVCDVYTWKLLRRDSGLSRRQTELALVELLNPILEES